MANKKAEIKPCPFCWSDNVADCKMWPYGEWRVKCQHCHAEGPPAQSSEEAIAFWNGTLVFGDHKKMPEE